MFDWIAKALLMIAGFIAGWFVESEAPQFALMQMVVSLILLVSLIWGLACWQERWTPMRFRLHNSPTKM
jgi:hypothetical protein